VGHMVIDFVRLAVILKVCVIGEDKVFMLGPHEQMAPIFETVNYS
jgi:hypothetical protein